MKLLRRAALGFAVVLAFAAAPRPAQAAGPYTILTHGTAPFTSTAVVWEQTKCSPTVLNSPANGIEARVVDVSAFAGRTVRITWSAATSAAAGGLGILSSAKAYDGACNVRAIGSSDWSITSNTMTMPIPAGTRWALFSGFGSANISFTIN